MHTYIYKHVHVCVHVSVYTQNICYLYIVEINIVLNWVK